MVWGFVEAGVGTIAGCIVTFRPLFAGRTIESVVNSVRSSLSLHSWKSNGDSQRHGTTTNGQTQAAIRTNSTAVVPTVKGHKDAEHESSDIFGVPRNSVRTTVDSATSDSRNEYSKPGIEVQNSLTIEETRRTSRDIV